jgi:hypothetical protein
MGQGKVDYQNLLRDQIHREKHIRWRTLRKIPDDGLTIQIFGYACHAIGPWFGYAKTNLREAPCSHCGQIDIFQHSEWTHVCPGYWDNQQLPCLADHACRGEPSMSAGLAVMWKSGDWTELPFRG